MLKKLITAALALSVSATAYAAADPLSQPAPSSRDLTAVQEMTAIVVPNAEGTKRRAVGQGSRCRRKIRTGLV